MGLVMTSSRWWSLDIVNLVALIVIYYVLSSTSLAVVTSWWRRLWLAWSFRAQVKPLRWLRLPWRTMATCGLLGMGLVTTSRRGCCLDSVVFVAQQVLYYDFATTPSTVVLSWLRRLWL